MIANSNTNRLARSPSNTWNVWYHLNSMFLCLFVNICNLRSKQREVEMLCVTNLDLLLDRTLLCRWLLTVIRTDWLDHPLTQLYQNETSSQHNWERYEVVLVSSVYEIAHWIPDMEISKGIFLLAGDVIYICFSLRIITWCPRDGFRGGVRGVRPPKIRNAYVMQR
jgi:hypothetical protein